MKKMNIYLLTLVFALASITWACNETSRTTAAYSGPKLGATDDEEAEDGEGEEDGEEEEEIEAFPDEHFQQFEKFDPSMFDENSIVIDNKWMPMEVGRQEIYKGSDMGDEGERIEHSLYSTATDLTKVINGVNCVVLYQLDYTEGGVLEEAELAFFAQDKEGNVWHFGQYVEHYDEDFFEGGRIWVFGLVEGARAGIYMPAESKIKVSDRSYSMGYAPAPFNWTDRFIIHETDAKVNNSSGNYTNVLSTREYSQEEPNAFQLKYYAAGVGNIGVGYIGDDPNAETMDLIEVKHLKGKDLAEVREAAMKLERRAAVYGQLAPAKVRK